MVKRISGTEDRDRGNSVPARGRRFVARNAIKLCEMTAVRPSDDVNAAGIDQA